MNDNISLDEKNNLKLGKESIVIKIDTTDKLGFMVDSMPHLVRHAHKCVQNNSAATRQPMDDYSCERELEIYNWMVRMQQSLQQQYDSWIGNLHLADIDAYCEEQDIQKVKDAKKVAEALKKGDPYWKEIKEKAATK